MIFSILGSMVGVQLIQGGLLDAYFNNKDGFIYFTYSHDFKEVHD